LLCQPRSPPPEIAGEWTGKKKMQLSEAFDNTIESCDVSVSQDRRSRLMIESSGCTRLEGLEKDQTVNYQTDIIFDAHIENCIPAEVSSTASPDGVLSQQSTGTLLAYTTDGLQVCYRYIRTTEGTLRMAYQITKHPEKNHHACPEKIVVSKDVAVLDLTLENQNNDALPEQLEWLCRNAMGTASESEPSTPEEDESPDDAISSRSESENSGAGPGETIRFMTFCAYLLTVLHVLG